MIPCQRHLFDIPSHIAYLNCAYMSPLATEVVAAGQAGLAQKATPWTVSPSDFFTESERARNLFARLINAEPDDIAIVPAASYGLATAARNLPLAAGQRLLILAEQFPSNVYAWQDMAKEHGATVVTVARPADDDWTSAILAELDERTAITALPHCHWTDGGLIDLIRIGERCRDVGSALVLDVTQSLGALPLDVQRIQPDFVVAGGYKWLLGPYSLGYLYVAPRHHGGRPLEQNWISRAGSEDFTRLIDYQSSYQAGARRFDVGERSNFALVPASLKALELILDWQVENIAATLAEKTRLIVERAVALGLETMPADRRAGHFVGLRFLDGMPGDLPARLAFDHVYVSSRGSSLRVTPHLYNNDADIDRLFDILEKAV